MAFKQPLSRGVTNRRSAYRESVSIARDNKGKVKLRIPKQLVKRARLDTDSVDIFVGSGKDAGLVRIRPGDSFRLSPASQGNLYTVSINPDTIGGFNRSGSPVRAQEAKVASVNAPTQSLSLHTPDGFLEG